MATMTALDARNSAFATALGVLGAAAFEIGFASGRGGPARRADEHVHLGQQGVDVGPELFARVHGGGQHAAQDRASQVEKCSSAMPSRSSSAMTDRAAAFPSP